MLIETGVFALRQTAAYGCSQLMEIEQEPDICVLFCGVDEPFINNSAARITVDIALSTVIAGIALTSLVLLLILWKRDDNIKRHAYSFCEWISLVWQYIPNVSLVLQLTQTLFHSNEIAYSAGSSDT